jgi:hypothetical protein
VNVFNLHGVDFYVLARIFETGAEAKSIFDELNRMATEERGGMDLGCYRFVPGGIGEARVVAVVSIKPNGVERVEALIGGDPFELDGPTAKALCLRRARVVRELYELGAEKGSFRVPHGEGARMNPDGTMSDDAAD